MPTRARATDRELTLRENDILQQLANGLTRAEVAEALDITENTVRTHCNHILMKTGARNTTHAVVLAIRRGDIR